MLTKEKLVSALSLIPDDAILEAQYNTGYSVVNCKIIGVNFNFKEDGEIEMVLCTTEIRKPSAIVSNAVEESAA